jgi:hypothetical protein
MNPNHLPAALDHRLNAYALAARAAGVALLACSPADSATVCKKVDVSLVKTDTFSLNPENLQIAPFNLVETYNDLSSLSACCWGDRGFIIPNSIGAAELLGAGDLPADVAFGAKIGPEGRFGKGRSYGLLFTFGYDWGGTYRHHQGNFQLKKTNYIGFKFSVSGEHHYGWVRLSVTFDQGGDGKVGTMHISSFGYETTPNTAVHAGQCSSQPVLRSPASSEQKARRNSVRNARTARPPASLGELAAGSSGMRVWRRTARD